MLGTNQQPFQDSLTIFFGSAHTAALISLSHGRQGHHSFDNHQGQDGHHGRDGHGGHSGHVGHCGRGEHGG